MKDNDPLETPEGVSAATKARIGFLLPSVVLITAGGSAAATHIDVLQRNSVAFCLAVGLAGLLGWCAGWWAERRRAQPEEAQDPPRDKIAPNQSTAVLGSLKYWGITLMLSGAALTYLLASPAPQIAASAAARPAQTNHITHAASKAVAVNNAQPVQADHIVDAATEALAGTDTKPVMSFPPLVLTGVILNGAKSSAMINGRVLYLGDMIGNVTLVAVDAGHATVTLNGQTNLLSLRR